MEAELVDVIAELLREQAEDPQVRLPEKIGVETVLLGEGGCLDSLGLVTLVVALEEAIEDRYSKVVALADEKAFSEDRSPFRTVGSLALFASQVVSHVE